MCSIHSLSIVRRVPIVVIYISALIPPIVSRTKGGGRELESFEEEEVGRGGEGVWAKDRER
jgi:hypothetical protein